MTPERLQQIEALYYLAREGAAGERAVLLQQADPELRREVERLLERAEGGSFLDRPALHNAPELLDDPAAAVLDEGDRLGPYRIEGRLGEGGMGEVFRAVDTRLGRAVAIKTTREQFSARFEREARAISSLNHPNICTLYDVGPNYLVMELLEGETIAARLKRGPFPLESVRDYGRQIAAALAQAHGKGIVHRDLKPGNIMITKSGAKVLDFGLAKSGQDDTVTDRHVVVGTPAYMAPEQRERKPTDARSDIYSLGCILYEMATGARVALARRRVASPQLERIVSRCLEEDPDRRWQSAAELERELAGVRSGRRQAWRAIVSGAVVLGLCVAAYFYLHRVPRLTDKDTIVLADFRNTTGDAVFDETLRQGLAVQLEQSPFLSLASEERIRKTLALMGRPADSLLTAELAREVCERAAAAAVLEGSISRLGSEYVLGLRARNCRTGDVLDEEQVTATRKEDVLPALSRIAVRFRTRTGESLATVEKHDTPLAEATTPSLEALKAYSTAIRMFYTAGDAAALSHFLRATEIDPNFAMAYSYLGRLYGDTEEPALSAASTRKAYELRNHASDQEKFFIIASYEMQVTGNLEKAQQIVEEWGQTYPREVLAPRFLSLILTVRGDYQKSIELDRKSIAIDPNFSPGYSFIADGYQRLNRFEDAENTLRVARERGLEMPEIFVQRYDLAFLKGDRAGMERELALAMRQSKPGDWKTNHEAFVLAYAGRLQQARTTLRTAVDAALAMSREKAALYAVPEALWEAFFGNGDQARKSAAAALQLSRELYVLYGAAFALAETGDSESAAAIAAELEKRFPEDTSLRFSYLPALRGRIALNRGDTKAAIELLETAAPYELGVPRCAIHGNFGALYPAYVRGEAYLAARQGGPAAQEFQRILDHRGIVVSDPIGALAHWQLGRALSLSGETAKARAAYQEFLTLWKDADPDIPVLRRAKAALARNGQ